MVDRPLIQHVVDEAREAGIEHFDLRHRPQQGRHRGSLRPSVRTRSHAPRAQQENRTRRCSPHDTPGAGTTSFTRQQAPLGLGHAVWCARDIVGNEPFAVRAAGRAGAERAGLPRADDRTPTDKQKGKANIIAVEEVPMDRVHMYGIVGVGKEVGGKALPITEDGREAASARSAVQPVDHRPLHPAAGNLRHAGEPADRRGRRNPAHRCDDHAGEDASPSTR